MRIGTFLLAVVGLALGAAGCGEGAKGGVRAEALLVDGTRLVVEAHAPGSADRLHGLPGAVPASSRVVVYGEAALATPVATTTAAADGGFAPLEIGDNLHAQLWLVAETTAGRSEPVVLANDVQGPAVTFLAAPPANGPEREARFDFACDEAPCTFACGLDGGVYADCTSPFRTQALDQGQHQLRVRATDAAGNPGEPAIHVWSVELEAPPISLDEVPPDPSNSSSATFRFSSVPGARFECGDVGDRWLPCTSPHVVGNTDGQAHFQVRAILDGSTSEPATYSWTIDTAGPEVERRGGPGLFSNDPAPVWEFVCLEEGCQTFCALGDEELYEPCTSPHTFGELGEGEWVLWIKAIDAIGNERRHRWQWEIDLTPPGVIFEQLPPAAFREPATTIAFACDEQRICPLSCSLDGSPFALCESPVLLAGLAEGPHLFEVIATDWVGNASAPFAVSFTVDDTAPAVRFDATPGEVTTATSASFEFACEGEPCTFTCALDLQDPAPCSSPWELEDVAPGPRSVTVTATDRVGLEGEATFSWTIEVQP